MTALTILIVSHNTRADLERCLEALHAAAPSAVSREVTVIDNASRDESPEAIRSRWPEVRLIELSDNFGFAAANNVGFRETQSELVLLLNSDTIVPPGALDRLVAEIRRMPEVAIVGPRLVDQRGMPELSFGRMIGPSSELRQKMIVQLAQRGFGPATCWIRRATSRGRFVDWVSGACLLVRRADAQAVGLLDERYFMYCEDVDFCAAVRARGRRVYFTPEAEIVHFRGRSAAAAPQLTEQAFRRSQLAFYRKHHPAWLPLLRAYLRLRGKLPPESADKSGRSARNQ